MWVCESYIHFFTKFFFDQLIFLIEENMFIYRDEQKPLVHFAQYEKSYKQKYKMFITAIITVSVRHAPPPSQLPFHIICNMSTHAI